MAGARLMGSIYHMCVSHIQSVLILVVLYGWLIIIIIYNILFQIEILCNSLSTFMYRSSSVTYSRNLCNGFK